MCPAALSPPGRIDAAREQVDTPEDMDQKVLLRRISTYPFSLANIPAIALPMGYTKNELPVSLQIAAKPFDEATVFRVAHAYERAAPWHQRHPDLARTLQQAAALAGA